VALTYPTSDVIGISITAGPQTTAAGKAVNCFGGSGSYTCVVSGMNTTIISDGAVAFVDLTIAAGVSATSIGLSNTVGSSALGDGIVVLSTGGTVVRGNASSGDYGGLDITTQGTWTGTYGADGYLIANDVSSPPGYAVVRLTGASLYTWAASTSDPRALQLSSGSLTRIASKYYSYTQFTIDVNLTDANTHRIALYLLDSHQSRTETISILDATSGRVLDTEAFPSFINGQYAVWNVTGHVLIQIQWTGGANAVVSGIFFDPPSSAKWNGLGKIKPRLELVGCIDPRDSQGFSHSFVCRSAALPLPRSFKTGHSRCCQLECLLCSGVAHLDSFDLGPANWSGIG
jgi:hypothetical protein